MKVCHGPDQAIARQDQRKILLLSFGFVQQSRAYRYR
jgi:hypothetical protein